ncbi:MAG: hypothetical protein JJT89_05255 [Nitriliruptoraceae bacterium]|nr:hypothetical protein [Nitriliruptoraceae bacterium]
MISQYLLFFSVFALLWGLQLYGTAKQGQHFMSQVSRLRREAGGETAIGASSMSRLRRRSYVALAAGDDDRVTGAVELRGLTVFSRAVPVQELVGRPLRELADGSGPEKRADAGRRRANAAAMAARALLDEAPAPPGPTPAAVGPGTPVPGGGRPGATTRSGRPSGRQADRTPTSHLPVSGAGTNA